MAQRHSRSPFSGGPCADCPLLDRLAFLSDVARLAASALVALGLSPVRAAAMGLEVVHGVRLELDEHAYPIPAADGASIDKDDAVIIVRYQQRAYVFNLSCPHQNTALRWHPDDDQFECPKHHSRYQPDGVFISGRATRSMDRFKVRQDADKIVADLDTLYRQDKDAPQWEAAFVALA
jgi:nitrite reductase/ring-hydroxylating ferredoxin subunit